MDIHELSKGLKGCDTKEQLETFLSHHLKNLRLYFYNKNQSEIIEASQDFENLFYDFKHSEGFVKFENSKNQKSEIIDSALVFFASIFERVNPNPIFSILDIIPKGSIYYRLKAHLCAYEEVNDIRIHYTKNFTKILDLLSSAQFHEEEDYTALIISFLTKFYRHAIVQLSGKQLTDEIILLNSLFKDTNLKEKYHFLSHPLIIRMVEGEIDFANDLVITDSRTSLFYPSDKMFTIFNDKIIQPVKSDSRTRFSEILLGFTAETIRRDILEYGRADFTTEYKSLTTDEKVLLYCYFNMRKHFFTSCYVFEKIYESLKPIFNHPEKTVVFIDLGCGPMTSGLALSDLHFAKTGNLLKINYLGVDISQAMLDKAKNFSEDNVFSKDSQTLFSLSWDNIPTETIKEYVALDNPIIINASYLFASSSLEISNLIKFVNDIVQKFNTSSIFVTYQNPNREDRNKNYDTFKSELIYKTHEKNVERVFYKNNPHTNYEPSAEDVYYEILELNT